jgi:3-deoxy-D-manno-octulosonic-acid transferase
MSFLYWSFHQVLSHFLKTFFFWAPALKKRWQFEDRNLTDLLAKSFRAINQKADLAFEFSSEGEYQQVASLITDALTVGKKIELVFFSPSVEKAMVELAEKFPTQIRYLRYPLASFGFFRSFSNWVTASELIMVRYDFFPEFLIWAQRPGHCLKIVWVTFKKERSSGKQVSVYKKYFLSQARNLVFATQADQDAGKLMDLNGPVMDFRMEQIQRRMDQRSEKFSIVFPAFERLKAAFVEYPREKRLILGNAWPVDMALLQDLPPDIFVLIVPHQLEKNILDEMILLLKRLGRMPLLMDDSFPGLGSTYVLNKKGVLCELYADFAKAYVGGGLGVSVHSILEPLVAGCESIACGPVHHRSTEFDLARDLGSMTEVKNAADFRQWMSLALPSTDSRDKIRLVSSQYPVIKKEVLSC